ncbi:hypothetical protein KNE206_37610 [Kitasatospora sp. NE20-6]
MRLTPAAWATSFIVGRFTGLLLGTLPGSPAGLPKRRSASYGARRPGHGGAPVTAECHPTRAGAGRMTRSPVG